MKFTTSSRRRIAVSLLPAFFSLILAGLQSCSAPTEITIKQAPGVVMASAEAAGGRNLLGYKTDDGSNGYSLARISDTSFVLGARAESETARLIYFNRTLGEKWSTKFALRDDERGIVWYKNSEIAVVTHYSKDDTLFLTGRHFDAASGRLLDSSRIAAIPVKDHFFRAYDLSYRMSPDSSKLFAIVTTFIDRIDKREDVELYRFLPLLHSLKAESIIEREIRCYYQVSREILVNNRGDIFYATYRPDNNRYELVRLRGTAADTLVFTPTVPNGGDPLMPASFAMTLSDDNTVLFAWNEVDDHTFKGMYIRKFDFARREISMNTMIDLSPQELMPLIDDDEIEDFFAHSIHSLPSGNKLVVGYQSESNVTVGSTPTGTYSKTFLTAGPILVMMLDPEGKKVWKTFLKRESELPDYRFEGQPVCIPGNDYVHVFYRDREVEAGLIYSQISLRDGAASTQTLPLFYSENSVFLPGCTLLNKDKTAVLVGLEQDKAKIIKFPLR